METTLDADDAVAKVPARIRYLAEGSDINRRFVAAGVERNTGTYADHEVVVRDGSAIKDRFKIDVHGFQPLTHRSAVADFHDSAEVERLYAEEGTKLVQALTGADQVAARGWMLRTSADLSHIRRVPGYKHHGGVQPPAGEAHVDFSPQTGPGAAASAYASAFPDGPGYSRFCAFSLWRAFSDPPHDVPLALCDGRSLADDEGLPNTLHIVDEIPSEAEMRGGTAPGDTGMAASIFRFRATHRWWYFSDLTRDEPLLFKFFDSDHSVTWRCPHTAFVDGSHARANHRESIELRLIAYWR